MKNFMDTLKNRVSWNRTSMTSVLFIIILSYSNTLISQPPDSLLIDQEGNSYALKALLDNTWWMTKNLNLNIPDSYCYDNLPENCNRYGRLYTWESAQKGCSQLGEGWRLPTDEEWQQLSRQYGIASDSIDYRKGAYITLLQEGSAGFNALLGGGRETNGTYARLDGHGFYWTSTAIDYKTAWNYNFARGSLRLYRQDGGEKSEAYAVRCVKKFRYAPKK